MDIGKEAGNVRMEPISSRNPSRSPTVHEVLRQIAYNMINSKLCELK